MNQETTSRDFNNFYLGIDNVYELSNGLIPEIADLLQIDAGSQPNSKSLGEIVGKLGSNKVLRNNVEVEAIEHDQMVDLLKRSGVQKKMNRSLWTPDIVPGSYKPEDLIEHAVMAGGVANWQDRAVRALPNWFMGAVYLPTGNRVMDSPTELSNENVSRFQEYFNRLPTEFEYAANVSAPKLKKKGRDVFVQPLPVPYQTAKGNEIAEQFFAENPHLTEERLLFVRVANAGVQLAVEMRRAARKVNPNFDSDAQHPQVFIATDTFPIATFSYMEKDPKKYQKAQTGLRQAALTAKYIFEAQSEDA